MSSSQYTEETRGAGSEEATTPDIPGAEDAEQQELEHVCLFCNKTRKKYQGREQQLQTCANDESISNLKRNVSEIGAVDILNKITALYPKLGVVYYHKFCRSNCRNALKLQIAAQHEKTEWHRSRDIHAKAFEQVCQFVLENVIEKKQCFFLSFLKSLFIDSAKGEITDISADIEPYSLEKRLLEAFPKKIAVVSMNSKKVLKPYAGVLVKNDLETIEK